MTTDDKILLLDIETAPMFGPTWKPWQTDLLWIEQDPYILMVGYQWLNEDEATVLALPDFKTTWKKNKLDDSKLVAKIAKLIDKADVLVGHNMAKFDWPWLLGQLVFSGHDPISQPIIEDTMLMSKNVKSPRHTLDYISERLGHGNKLSHSGINLWRRCLAGDLEAFEEMRAYCKRDVEILKPDYLDLRRWFGKNIASSDQGLACTKCGHGEVVRRGFYTTAGGSKYQKYVCKSCGGWSRSRHQSSKSALTGGRRG